MKLCSACLLGVKCRYDGKSKPNKKVTGLSRREVLIPVCPEQLGGLPTPREPSEIRKNRVMTKSGKDVTRNFIQGAEETLKLARRFGIKEAVFKQNSPSCGCGRTYDGTFTGRLVRGDGITAILLKRNGIRVVTEEELE